jgi:integrase
MGRRTRVEKGIYRSGDAFHVVASGPKDVDGKYRQVSRAVHGSLRDARRERARLQTELGTQPRPAEASAAVSATLAEVFARFMANKLDLAPRTIELYEALWKNHCEDRLGAIPVATLSAWDLDETYRIARSRLSATSTRKLHKLLNAVLAQAVRWELVTRNVAVLASPPREAKPTITPPALDDYAKLVRAADESQPDFATLVRLAAVTGLRRGELCGLRFEDFDEGGGTLAVRRQIVLVDGRPVVSPTKTRATRVLPLDATTAVLLKGHHARAREVAQRLGVELPRDAYVFSTMPTSERPLRPDGVSARFAKLAAAAGVRCRFHDLRHLCGTQMIAAGVDAKTVADRLGHSTPVVTLAFYTHSVTETQRRAADVIGDVIGSV